MHGGPRAKQDSLRPQSLWNSPSHRTSQHRQFASSSDSECEAGVGAQTCRSPLPQVQLSHTMHQAFQTSLVSCLYPRCLVPAQAYLPQSPRQPGARHPVVGQLNQEAQDALGPSAQLPAGTSNELPAQDASASKQGGLAAKLLCTPFQVVSTPARCLSAQTQTPHSSSAQEPGI